MIDGFSFVDELVPGVRWDSRYATWDNFTGKPVDGYLVNRIVGSTELCAALAVASGEAAARGFGLLLWDGYRPQRGTNCFLRWSQEAEDGRTSQRHYPSLTRAQLFECGYVSARSGHTRGSSIDLTVFDLSSSELADMGGDHDLMDEVSHHGAPGISASAAANRETLKVIMERSGFAPYDSEWWHYTLINEPYPDTYFDFVIDGA
jgi:zinc D-Ala-D-Ala dipeptidase